MILGVLPAFRPSAESAAVRGPVRRWRKTWKSGSKHERGVREMRSEYRDEEFAEEESVGEVVSRSIETVKV